MNREIKFRAWSGALNKMVYEFDTTRQIGFGLYQEDDSNDTSENQPIFCGGYLANGDWDQPILMQYSGFEDIEGVPIYEGDILAVPEFYETPEMSMNPTVNWLLVFKHGMFVLETEKYPAEHDTEPFCRDYSSYDGNIQVLGNIHTTPELLNRPK